MQVFTMGHEQSCGLVSAVLSSTFSPLSFWVPRGRSASSKLTGTESGAWLVWCLILCRGNGVLLLQIHPQPLPDVPVDLDQGRQGRVPHRRGRVGDEGHDPREELRDQDAPGSVPGRD